MGLISSAASLVGGLIANKGRSDTADAANRASAVSTERQIQFQRRQNRIARDFNRREAHKARRFAKNMSSTAHRRQIRDLRAAGLNPILSARYGGASSPGASPASISGAQGASYTGQQAQVQDALTPAVQNYWSAKSQQANIENIQADTDLKDAQTDKTAQDTTESKERVLKIAKERLKIDRETSKLIMDTEVSYQRIKLLQQQTGLTNRQIKELKARFPGIAQEGKIDETLYGQIIRYIMRLNPLAPNISIRR